MRGGAVDRMRLPDGRVLAWAEYGDRGGAPLVVLHGIPGSRVLPGILGPAAHARGVRLVVPDRPGYGRSDPDRSSDFFGFCGDLRVLLDHLALDRVAVAGISGGAGYALAAAAVLGDRLDVVVLVSGMVPPLGRADLRVEVGSPVESFLARRAPWLLALALRAGAGVLAHSGPRGAALLLCAMPAVDRRAARANAPMPAVLAADVVESLRQGGAAAVRDLRRYYTGLLDMGVTTISTPVEVVHGAADTAVPVAAAYWIHEALPTARLTIVQDAGHLMVFTDPEVLLDLVRTR